MSRYIKYFFLSSLLLLVFGVFINTGKAQAACTTNPSLVFLSTTNKDWSVVYHLRLVDNCSGTNTYNVKVPTALPIKGNWEVENNGVGNTYQTNISGSKDIDVTVSRTRTVYQADGAYSFVVVRANLNGNTSVNDEIKLIYNIINKPDIEITAFNFPSGSECSTSDVNLRIKNTGWKSVTATFDVRVDNGGGNTRTRPVTQNLGHDEALNISSLFTNMPIPPARASNYNAIATVDLNKDVAEEGEENNEATNSYKSTTCVTPTPIPPSGHSISGTIHVDSNNNNTLDSTDPKYTGQARVGAHSISTNISTFDNSLNNGVYSVTGLANDTFIVSVANLDLGYRILNASNATHPRSNVIINGSNASNINFLVSNTPPPPPPPNSTYSISGAIFIDYNNNGQRDDTGTPTETLIAGTLQMTGPNGYNKPINVPAGASYNVSNLPAGQYTITYPWANIPSGFKPTYPPAVSPGPPSTAIVTVGPNCSPGTHIFAICDSSGNLSVVKFGIISGGLPPSTPTPLPPAQKAWIQGVGGDMRVDNGLANDMPAGSYYFSNFDPSLNLITPGIVFGTPSLRLGGNPSDRSSIKKWYVSNTKFAPNVVETSYSQMKANIVKSGDFQSAVSLFGPSSPCQRGGPICNLSTTMNGGIYTAGRIIMRTISSPYNFLPNNNYVFLIDGDLRIENDIIVPPGSSVIFAVKGNITIADNVKRIDGIYSADNDFIVEGVSSGADIPLAIQGSVIANAGLKQYSGGFPGTFKDERSLGVGNLDQPAVQITYRPDFVLSAPELLRFNSYIRQEVAPGP